MTATGAGQRAEFSCLFTLLPSLLLLCLWKQADMTFLLFEAAAKIEIHVAFS